MGSLDSVPWHEIPIIGDLGTAFAQTGVFNDVWLPAWDVFAQGVNYIFGAPILWHR
ncbi:hypothetical protein GCM10022231_00340 [Gordonia caeni]|uniref:Uncharacterized protein n=2 Tax=Gordonia caeni TaxID=1007097 RepID=A0ABP7NHP7_9ACTN